MTVDPTTLTISLGLVILYICLLHLRIWMMHKWMMEAHELLLDHHALLHPNARKLPLRRKP